MIKLTRMDGQEIVVNAELIETVKATPDTVINLTSGKRVLVLDDVDDIIEKVMSYRQRTMGCKGVE